MKSIITIISIAAPCLLFAQPAPTPAPLPKGPLLARAPQYSQWVIAYNSGKAEAEKTDASEAQAAPSQVRQVVVTKTKDTYHEEVIYKSGARSNFWRIGGLQVTIDPRSKDVTVMDGGSNPAFGGNYSKTDFPGLEWISSKTYVDVKKFSGVDCIIFKQSPPSAAELTDMINKGVDLSGRPPEELEVELTAYVDLATRLPIYFQMGNELRAYKFQPLPAAMQQIPQEVQTVLDQRVRTAKELTKSPPRPF